MALEFLCLPLDILILVISHLPPYSLRACSCTCRSLQNIVEQFGPSDVIRMLKGFSVEGLSTSRLSAIDCLAHLESWERAWASLDMGSPCVVRSPPHRECGELLIQGDFLVDVRSDKSWASGRPGWSYFDMSKLPGGKWTHINFESGMRIVGWALDVSQDLIAVASKRHGARSPPKIHFRHFSSGMRYSISTCTPELELVGKCESKFSVQMELIQTRLLVLVAHGSIPRRRESLYLVDRTQGRINCVRHASRGTYFPILTFISEDTLVLGRKRDWALEVCQVAPGEQHGTYTLQTLCVLKLPSYLR
ncbi:hypothetical protein BC834DRAFT_154216 [Gloeopeniophorella convolvens]|nr:hypothetical protein BC834DRAFT_154216 [Gloeopeniophorella convolvens]